MTRLKAREGRNEAILWPPNPAPYLTDWLLEIGPTTNDGPIQWGEIRNWQIDTGIELDPWEARTIRRLSQAFVAQRYAAEKPDCPAPYNGDRTELEARRHDVARRVEMAFRMVAAQSDEQPAGSS